VNKLSILVVDDQEGTREGVKAILEFVSDMQVTHQASTGEEAILVVDEAQPDIVLMDVRMPVMDGLQATQQIKKRWPDTKVIIFSIYPGYEAQALAVGADCFLIKEANSGNLKNVIRDVASSG
jgi:DNA-binding NarL/FixJ family response regulator